MNGAMEELCGGSGQAVRLGRGGWFMEEFASIVSRRWKFHRYNNGHWKTVLRGHTRAVSLIAGDRLYSRPGCEWVVTMNVYRVKTIRASTAIDG